jgi:hypothetical protein
MGLLVVGAGLPRTGTRSLKEALEILLNGRCYHMEEVFSNLDHVPVWRRALTGEPTDWNGLLEGYVAAVDWPASAFWRELSAANPQALVILSTRSRPRSWWRSADRTILPGARMTQPADLREWQCLFRELLDTRLSPDWSRESSADDAHDRHNEQVRAAAPPRFLEWQATQGWEPLCRALGVAVPDRPFPHFAGVHPRVDAERVGPTISH